MMRPLAAELNRTDRSMLITAVVAALCIGGLAAATSPLVPAAALIGILTLAAIWWRPIVGIGLFVAIVAALPFGVIPVPLGGAQLTLVDAVLIATFAAVLARVVFGDASLPLDAPAVAVIAFVVVAIAAFVVGAGSTAISPELIRRTGKLLASLLFFVIARSLLTMPDRLARLTRWLIFAGALQGAIGAGLRVMSPLTQLTLLTRLQVIGYPTADVLRYVPGPNNTYTTQLRATGTSVDPNVFGGTLMLALALIVVQWASPRPVLRKSVLVLLAIPTAAGLLLSLSRASWTGLAVGLLVVGVVRYRRILVLGLFMGLAVFASPIGQALVVRFVSGFSTADPATAFRVGEYTNALTLLSRYPLLGIGFGASPDIDVTAGVSSVYLLVSEQTGLLGLSMYLVALTTTWYIGIRDLRKTRDERLQAIRAAFLAALSGALLTGLLDHYFANQAFPHAVALFWLYAAALVCASRLSSLTPGEREPERTAAARPTAFGAHRPAV
jgi:polysaccharide biosynthesis protein PslJ